MTLTPRFLALPAITSVGGRQLAGICALALVFVAVVAVQALKAAGAAFSRDLTLRQVCDAI